MNSISVDEPGLQNARQKAATPATDRNPLASPVAAWALGISLSLGIWAAICLTALLVLWTR